MMKKQNLMTGDIVVTRDGSVGIVIAEKEVVIYPESGMDFYDDFTEDLLLDDDYRGGDIMAVYRDEFGGVVGFTDYEDYDPVFEREDDVVWRPDMHWKNQLNSAAEEAPGSADSEPKKKMGWCVIQAFYGNRVVTDFSEEIADGLIAGNLDNKAYDIASSDRCIIHLPGEEELVLVYNKSMEERSLQDKEEYFREDGYVLKPLAEIPELDVVLYSRCLACRMSAEGRLMSLREGDYEKVIKYLAK